MNVYTHHVALRLPTGHGHRLYLWTLLLSKMSTSRRAMHNSFQDSGLEMKSSIQMVAPGTRATPMAIEAVQESSGLLQAEGLL